MKAVRLVQAGLPVQEQEIELPAVGADDLLVRVRAAGICHSDAHYRAGVSPAGPLPLTLGHEVAGIVAGVGSDVSGFAMGDRVCLHYMVTCGHCTYCHTGSEQFCATGQMLGKHRDGGYAEYIVIPARGAFHLPTEIPFGSGAIMMCSSATSLHALNKARLRSGESVAVFGIGGLGISAVQLASAMDAGDIYAVDINSAKLCRAEALGAIPVNAHVVDPVAEIRSLTNGQGVDVALELIGLPLTMQQAVRCLGIFGRAALVGLTDRSIEIAPYEELLNREAEVIGVSDHLASEIPVLLEYAQSGALDLSGAITRTVSLDAAEINGALDQLDAFGDEVRVVIDYS